MKIRQMSPQLLVADLERSIKFYTQFLGFQVDFRYEDFYAGIINDSHSIHFKCGKPVPGSEDEHLDLVFSVGAIDELFAVLQGEGVTIVQPLRKMPYGREFYIADPDGYILGFIENE